METESTLLTVKEYKVKILSELLWKHRDNIFDAGIGVMNPYKSFILTGKE